MELNTRNISERIKALRIAKKLRQAELDQAAGLPMSSISKVENQKRELTASELMKVSEALGVTLDSLAGRDSACVYREEALIVEALREIPFDDYRLVIRQIEASLHFLAKDKESETRTKLKEMVLALAKLSAVDSRPRSRFAETKRVRN